MRQWSAQSDELTEEDERRERRVESLRVEERLRSAAHDHAPTVCDEVSSLLVVLRKASAPTSEHIARHRPGQRDRGAANPDCTAATRRTLIWSELHPEETPNEYSTKRIGQIRVRHSCGLRWRQGNRRTTKQNRSNKMRSQGLQLGMAKASAWMRPSVSALIQTHPIEKTQRRDVIDEALLFVEKWRRGQRFCRPLSVPRNDSYTPNVQHENSVKDSQG